MGKVKKERIVSGLERKIALGINSAKNKTTIVAIIVSKNNRKYSLWGKPTASNITSVNWVINKP